MAIFSMTGYGAAEGSLGSVAISAEMRSVNNRFLDVIFRLPNVYQSYEPSLSKLAKDVLRRGRVEISINREDSGESEYELRFDKDLFGKYLEVGREALKAAGSESKESLEQLVFDVLRRREVVELVPARANIEDEYSTLEKVVRAGLEELVKMRLVEGKTLETDVLGYVDSLEKLVKEISKRAGDVAAEFAGRLTARLEKLSPGVELDETRLTQEVALLADRTDISEELVRLGSHIEQFRQIIRDGEGGRKLEFLLQEMLREINTTGSKAQNAEIAAQVVEAKALVEKIREQVQNIE